MVWSKDESYDYIGIDLIKFFLTYIIYLYTITLLHMYMGQQGGAWKIEN